MYLDSSIIVKLLVDEPDSDFFQDALTGSALVTSELSKAEVPSALLIKERQKFISAECRWEALGTFDKKIAAREIKILTIDSSIYSRARHVMEACHPHAPLRSLDAIHLSVCQNSFLYPFVTTDARLRAAAAKLGIPVFPETLPS